MSCKSWMCVKENPDWKKKTKNNWEFARVLKLNEAVVQNQKILPYQKRVDRRLSDIQKSISFAISADLKIEDQSLKCQKEYESSFDHKKVVSTAIDVISFMAKTTHSISAERRDRLKPDLNEEVPSFWKLYHLNISLEKIWIKVWN